ncbi:UV excision repair protein RAD23 homolog B [Drosophila pseudoobscura]|uniref:UV excision repair protein RAD23 n=1 Tax=Drosophila pseudoobscura pseudoobscura TaxID=46245 RepID=A0A6I8UPH2_DROPS|nr:UV excision repair protein RAD23 homolog B [Drosophila pseudoobscura]
MKLSIRTLDQRVITLEMDEGQNVLALKKRLVSMPGISQSVDSLQLIYGGRIMEDELPLSEYKIAEDKFLVLMGKQKVQQVTKVELEKKPKETASAATGAGSTPSGDTGAETYATEARNPTSSVAPNEEMVQRLMGMGYEEMPVRAALSASFNHPELAIEYLIAQIPSEAASGTASPVSVSPSVAEMAANLAPLMSDPRFAQLREMILQNPDQLEAILGQMSGSNPEVFEGLRNHHGEFVDLLNYDLSLSDDDEFPQQADSALQTPLTAAEAAAVDRLTALGFQHDLAVQVYLACNKNEELAADVLFRQSEEDQ